MRKFFLIAFITVSILFWNSYNTTDITVGPKWDASLMVQKKPERPVFSKFITDRAVNFQKSPNGNELSSPERRVQRSFLAEITVDLNGIISGYNALFISMWNISEEIMGKPEEQVLRIIEAQTVDPQSFFEDRNVFRANSQEVRGHLELQTGKSLFYSIESERHEEEVVGITYQFSAPFS